jgi:hypothetical protein
MDGGMLQERVLGKYRPEMTLPLVINEFKSLLPS